MSRGTNTPLVSGIYFQRWWMVERSKRMRGNVGFPQRLGATDRKRISIKCLNHRGSSYYNYKKNFYSVVIRGMGDAGNRSTFLDISKKMRLFWTKLNCSKFLMMKCCQYHQLDNWMVKCILPSSYRTRNISTSYVAKDDLLKTCSWAAAFLWLKPPCWQLSGEVLIINFLALDEP